MPGCSQGARVAGKLKTWVWIVIAVIAVCILGLVAIAGVGFYYVSQHVETKHATPATAATEFEAVKAGFAGQKPLIELDNRGQFLRAHTDRPVPAQSKSPDQLCLLAFDPSDSRIVRFSLPFWLLRMKAGNTTIDLNGNRMDLEDLRLSVEDLERYGPTLIVDHQAPDGQRVLVWSK
jgi:hypothetical protein